MEKSCKYCYQTHKEDFICKKKPIKISKSKHTEANKFRNTLKWQKKREEIKERDNYFCQICIRNICNTFRQYNHENLEVHHNVPINKSDVNDSNSDELNLDSSNLLTVCAFHHQMCEKGQIPFQRVKKIIQEQNLNQSGV